VSLSISNNFEKGEIDLKEALDLVEAMDLQEMVEEMQLEGEVNMEDRLSVGKLEHGYATRFCYCLRSTCTQISCANCEQ